MFYSFHQQLLIYGIKKTLDVKINGPAMCESIACCRLYCLMTVSLGTISKRTVMKLWLYYTFQMSLYHLLCDAIKQCRNTQLAHTSRFLLNRYFSYRLREVTART